MPGLLGLDFEFNYSWYCPPLQTNAQLFSLPPAKAEKESFPNKPSHTLCVTSCSLDKYLKSLDFIGYCFIVFFFFFLFICMTDCNMLMLKNTFTTALLNYTDSKQNFFFFFWLNLNYSQKYFNLETLLQNFSSPPFILLSSAQLWTTYLVTN